MRRRFWLGIAAVTLVALGSVVAAVLVYSDDRNDFDQMQHEEAVRAAHQAEAVAAVSVGKLATAAAFCPYAEGRRTSTSSRRSDEP